MRNFISIISIGILSAPAFGCAAIPVSNIPGLSISPIYIGDEVATSDVLKAVTCQISDGSNRVEELKKTTYLSDETANKFKYRSGSGSLSGAISTENRNTVSLNSSLILAGLPASAGGVPSTTKPDASGKISRTTKRTDTLTFSIKPDIRRSNDSECQNLLVATADNSVSDSLVDHFLNTISAANGADTLTFNMKSVKTQLNFIVEKTTSAGIGATTFPAAPYTLNFLPTLSGARVRNGTYILEFTLPTAEGDTDSGKLLIYCVRKGNAELCEESPFSPEKKAELEQQLAKQTAVVEPAPNKDDTVEFLSQDRGAVRVFPPATLPEGNPGPGF